MVLLPRLDSCVRNLLCEDFNWVFLVEIGSRKMAQGKQASSQGRNHAWLTVLAIYNCVDNFPVRLHIGQHGNYVGASSLISVDQYILITKTLTNHSGEPVYFSVYLSRRHGTQSWGCNQQLDAIVTTHSAILVCLMDVSCSEIAPERWSH